MNVSPSTLFIWYQSQRKSRTKSAYYIGRPVKWHTQQFNYYRPRRRIRHWPIVQLSDTLTIKPAASSLPRAWSNKSKHSSTISEIKLFLFWFLSLVNPLKCNCFRESLDRARVQYHSKSTVNYFFIIWEQIHMSISRKTTATWRWSDEYLWYFFKLSKNYHNHYHYHYRNCFPSLDNKNNKISVIERHKRLKLAENNFATEQWPIANNVMSKRSTQNKNPEKSNANNSLGGSLRPASA